MDLYCTPQVYSFLWEQWDPRGAKSGILLAGNGADLNWYATTAVAGKEFFSVTNTNDVSNLFLRDHLEQQKRNQKVIPWYQGSLEDAVKDYQEPFHDVMLVRPSEKKSSIMQYYVYEEGLWVPGTAYMTEKVDILAEKNIAELMDFWRRIKSATKKENETN